MKHPELYINKALGYAYQVNMNAPVTYDYNYLEKILNKERADPERHFDIADFRARLIMNWYMKEPHICKIIDIGCGSALVLTMLKRSFRTARIKGVKLYGYEEIAKIKYRLIAENMYYDIYKGLEDDYYPFRIITMFDVLEHMKMPDIVLNKIEPRSKLICTIPVVEKMELDCIRSNKHYRPNEHYWYWTTSGFIHWMWLRGFHLWDDMDHEKRLGRESVHTFVFERF